MGPLDFENRVGETSTYYYDQVAGCTEAYPIRNLLKWLIFSTNKDHGWLFGNLFKVIEESHEDEYIHCEN